MRVTAHDASPEATAARAGLRGVVWLGAVLAVVGIATFVTYARLPVTELYHVSRNGVGGGAGRLLVLVNFPVALIALAVLPIVVDRLLPRHRRVVVPLAWAAAVLCLVVAVPGVVDADDLDPQLINAVPLLGVLLVLALAVAAARGGLAGRPAGRVAGDRVRVALVAGLALLAVPWLFAEFGLFAPWPFLSDTVPAGEDLAAVHVGRHHGMDGVLIAVAAVVLSRELGRMRSPVLARVTAGYLALAFTYGVGNAAQDFWLEQVVKRGWTSAELPNLTEPGLTPAWAAVVVTAVVLYALWSRSMRPAPAPEPDVGTAR
jgi:hypothetical protein